MEGKWTSGEWRIGAGGHIIGARVTPVAFICRGGDFQNAPGEAEANAHLIVAAPTMAGAIAGYLSAKAALAEFESENPNDSTSNWERLFDARCAAEDQLQPALSQALGEPS